MVTPNKYAGNGKKIADLPQPTIPEVYERLCSCANKQISISFSAKEAILLAAFTTRLLEFAHLHGIGKEASEPIAAPTEDTKA